MKRVAAGKVILMPLVYREQKLLGECMPLKEYLSRGLFCESALSPGFYIEVLKLIFKIPKKFIPTEITFILTKS